MGPRGRFYPYLYILHILDCLGQDMQVLYLDRAPRTKESLPDFLKWRRVTRPPLVFRGLTGSQRTPGFWVVTVPLPIRRQVNTEYYTRKHFVEKLIHLIETLPIIEYSEEHIEDIIIIKD